MDLVEATSPKRGTRPRNRRALILEAATSLFVDDGYPQVSIGDISAAVAITPPALYRHFRSKDELLYESVASQLAAVHETLETRRRWDEQCKALAETMLSHRGIGILWQRESRHLNPDLRTKLRSQLIEIQRALAEQLRDRRPRLSDSEVDLLAWSTLTATMSISFQSVQLPHAEYEQLLVAMICDVTETNLSSVTATETPRREATPNKVHTTADRLVHAALELFSERGFKSVGIIDVAAAAGIAGPSAYSHFDSKVALLTAAMGDGARVLMSEERAILTKNLTPHETLRGLLRSYVDFSFANHHLLDLMITETNNLNPRERSLGIERQRDYLRVWVRVLQEVQPLLTAAHARVRVQAVLTLTNDLARTTHLRSLPGVQGAAIAIGASILGLEQD